MKRFRGIYRLLPHIVFIVLAALVWTSPAVSGNKIIFLVLIAAVETALLTRRRSASACDIALIVFLFLAAWEIYSTRIQGANTMLVPPPEKVFAIYVSDWRKIFSGIFSSLRLLFTALFFALALGISLGMLIGWFERPRKAFFPIAKIISPIPPIIYSPYAVALLPSFRSASLFIIFSSIFWPIFMNMIISVSTVDRRILESAKTLNIDSLSMFLHVLFPYCLPRVLSGMTVIVSTSFMVLTAAELLGATSGLGWFVKYYADFADYTRVIAGIIMIGVVVTALNRLVAAAEKILIRWK
ncbi:MAG: ABC transporter permease subunit [Treponema sp.]|jgi:NitT/TauT family transport system permease protein|nr:ABC transporter permease subunit [Treponema sp.]